MQYAMFIYESPEAFARREAGGEVAAAYLGSWMHYAAALRAAGVVVGGNGLLPPVTATTLRLRDGRSAVQDGPYADTKEQLGGYFVLEVADLDAALAWAAKCPAAADGGVLELRPVMAPMPQAA